MFGEFCKKMGYDVVTQELSMNVLANHSKTLSGHEPGYVKDRADFEKIEWEKKAEQYFIHHESDIEAFCNSLPEGMKTIGGIGNGIFEFVQDLTGYTELYVIQADDPELYGLLFEKTGDLYKKTHCPPVRKSYPIRCGNTGGSDVSLAAIEIKSSEKPNIADLKAFHSFADDYPETPRYCFCRTPFRYEENGIVFFPWREGIDFLTEI